MVTGDGFNGSIKKTTHYYCNYVKVHLVLDSVSVKKSIFGESFKHDHCRLRGLSGWLALSLRKSQPRATCIEGGMH
jgi:hypothetical protein